MGYPHFPMNPYQNQMSDIRIPRLTKPLAQDLIAQRLGVHPDYLKFDRIEEVPMLWRHACAARGVSCMKVDSFQYLTGETITYGVCPACGRIYYHYDQF